MSDHGFVPRKDIPETALYFAIRGLHGQKAVPTERVNTIRSFAKRSPKLGAEGEKLVLDLYGAEHPSVAELESKYKKLSQSQKHAFWRDIGDDAAKLFVQGEINRVLKFL